MGTRSTVGTILIVLGIIIASIAIFLNRALEGIGIWIFSLTGCLVAIGAVIAFVGLVIIMRWLVREG